MRCSRSHTLTYLRHHVPADELTVNRLFVSAYLEVRGVAPPRAGFLSRFVIKHSDNENSILQEVCRRIISDFGKDITLETMVQLFEFVVSPADRIVTGAIYTPIRIRKAIIANCLNNMTIEELQKIHAADISCGCGGFLMDMALLIHQKTGKPYSEIYRENIYGIDIQPYAIERTKILLSLLALIGGEDEDFEFNLICRDSLDVREDGWDGRYRNFDVIIGNPPYVCSRNLTDETLEKLKRYEVCRTGHPDLYIPFFQIALEMLSDNGRMGYITMNTFLRSVNGRALRFYLSNQGYTISIIDFRGYQVFESRNTYTCLFFLNKANRTRTIQYAVDENSELPEAVNYNIIPLNVLDNNKGWTLNDFVTTTAIEATGIQIKDYCPSRHGIATLSNETYIFRPEKENDRYYFHDGFRIEREICRDVVNPNKLNTVDDIDALVEKVIFPYYIEDGRAIVYEPDEMKRRFPRAFAYLKAKKKVLFGRDKGDISKYPQWYAFGRTQSLVMPRYKLFFPKFANMALKCVICDAPNLMLYNGLAFVSDDERKLRILKSVIESEIFWSYIKKNGKPYASGYYSLSGVDIKHFGIPEFTSVEEDELLEIDDKNEKEHWLKEKYRLSLTHV